MSTIVDGHVVLAGPESASPPGSGWRPIVVLAGACIVAFLAIVQPFPVLGSALLVAGMVLIATLHRHILSWPALICGLLAVILLIPIRRYGLPINLPFDMEPYRALVGFIAVGWLGSLLVDRRVRLRASGFDLPIAVLALAVALSLAFNAERVGPLGDEVVKAVTFLASFLLVFYIVVSLVRSRALVDAMVGTLVLGGAAVGVFALIEARTGWNVFNELARVPLLETARLPEETSRGGRLRVFGSAQHPIALGATLAVIFPLSLYLAKRSGRWIWWVPAALLVLGAFSTVSRTSVLMLAVAGLVLLALRPREMRRLVIPALIAVPLIVHLALPGTMGSLQSAFFPEGGLVAEQQEAAGQRGAGRVADLGPALSEYAETPLVGQGYGTRIVMPGGGGLENADILDNQWLKSLLEVGIVGVVAWVWLFWIAVVRLGRAARGDPSADGWLPAALAASIAAFAAGMLTFDAFSFIQVTFLFFVLLALGACTLRLRGEAPETAHRPSE